MIRRPTSRRRAWRWVSKWQQDEGTGSVATKLETSFPIWRMTGRSRTVKGKRVNAKGVASRALASVAWSIEASLPVKRNGFVTPTSQARRLIFQEILLRVLRTQGPFGQKTRDFRRNPWHWRDCTLSICRQKKLLESVPSWHTENVDHWVKGWVEHTHLGRSCPRPPGDSA